MKTEMERALELDGEKLRAMTGADHGPFDLAERLIEAIQLGEALDAYKAFREPRIVTVHAFPPIPDRRNDWYAYRDGEEERGDYGWGATEVEAVRDLIENVEGGE